MIVVPFHVEHLAQLALQPHQAYLASEVLTPGYAEALATGDAFSCFEGDELVMCAGVLPIWEGRGLAWALLSASAGRVMLALTRATLRFLKVCRYRRVETHVEVEFAAGHQWMRMLGFEREGCMRAYSPDGRDCDLYARIS